MRTEWFRDPQRGRRVQAYVELRDLFVGVHVAPGPIAYAVVFGLVVRVDCRRHWTAARRRAIARRLDGGRVVAGEDYDLPPRNPHAEHTHVSIDDLGPQARAFADRLGITDLERSSQDALNALGRDRVTQAPPVPRALLGHADGGTADLDAITDADLLVSGTGCVVAKHSGTCADCMVTEFKPGDVVKAWHDDPYRGGPTRWLARCCILDRQAQREWFGERFARALALPLDPDGVLSGGRAADPATAATIRRDQLRQDIADALDVDVDDLGHRDVARAHDAIERIRREGST